MVIEITLLIVFILFFGIGYYIIYKQVALVKKGEFKFKDHFKCFFYGLIFSLSVMIVIAVAFIFAVETPEFWQTTAPEVHPLVLIIPLIICLVYISIYPLVDFLFIALTVESDEGLTPFHKLLSKKIINLSKHKVLNLLNALALYILLFILPPLILSFIGLPFVMVWITWMLIYPLMILTFYGSKGYIAGITNAYYQIPNINRSIFLNFENKKRGMKQFSSEPGPYIVLGLMLFVFVWAWISLVQTISFYFTMSLAISTMSSVFVFVTLLFGILGYFTRFWGRKIKYRGIDVYFAAYLMGSIGINVLVNFLIVNPNKLFYTFNLWSLTRPINLWSFNRPNFLMFAWAAVIEEIVLIGFTSYYFIARKNDFIKNIRYSKITECGQSFDPIPLFNFIKNRNLQVRNHAEETLTLMFERLPFKPEIDINDWKFKNSLLDGICDNNPFSRTICKNILIQLEKDIPTVILPWIIEAIKSPNYDKSVPFTRTLLKADMHFLNEIPKELIFDLVEEPEWRLKLLGLKLISRLLKKDKEIILNLNIKSLIDDPNTRIQAEVLNLLSKSSLKLPVETIIDKIFHTNNEISAAAIKNIKNLNIKDLSRKIVSRLIPLMKNPSSSVRASIFEVFAKIGNFKKNNIQVFPFLDGLTDSNENTRNAVVNALTKYYDEVPDMFNLDNIIKQIDLNNFEILNSVVSLLGRLWRHSPDKILTTLLMFIKFEDTQLKENISGILTEKYQENPNLIFSNLIKIPDVSKFITKGIISRTLINIGKRDPKIVIQKLIDYLNDEDDNVRLNSVDTLDGLAEDYYDDINIKPILKLLTKDNNNQVKKKASIIISKIAKKNPLLIKPYISEFFQVLNEQDLSVRIVLSKSVLEIAKDSPEIIPLQLFLELLSDNDSFIRETSVKILGYIGYKLPEVVIDALINKALIDDDWIVREAAVSSLGNIIDHIESKEPIIEKLVTLLDDEQNWVQISALYILSKIKEVDNTHLPFNKLMKSVNSDDPKVREASAGLIKIYGKNFEEIFDIVVKLLEDDIKEVRNSGINGFVGIIQDIGLSRILSKLLQNLSDEGSIETQRSIALILGRTVRYEDEKIKKRVISLLKIRCEMSQDPIICATLQQLKES